MVKPERQVQPVALSVAVPEDGAELPGLPGLTVAVLRAAGGEVRAAVGPGQVGRVRPEGRGGAAAQTSARAQERVDCGTAHQDQGQALT